MFQCVCRHAKSQNASAGDSGKGRFFILFFSNTNFPDVYRKLVKNNYLMETYHFIIFLFCKRNTLKQTKDRGNFEAHTIKPSKNKLKKIFMWQKMWKTDLNCSRKIFWLKIWHVCVMCMLLDHLLDVIGNYQDELLL